MSALHDKTNCMAYWGPRRESLDDCAQRALDCLHKLALCDEAFARQWLYCGKSLKEALSNKVTLTFESVRHWIDKNGRNRNDVGELLEDLGLCLGRLWNGKDAPEAVHVTFQCGAYVTMRTLPVPNTCRIELPRSGPAAERLLRVEAFRKCMNAVVSSYDPDWAQVTNIGMIDAIYPDKYFGHRVGWVTYVSDRYGRLPGLPAEYDVTRIDGLGSLIVIKGVDRLTASNPTHVAAVRYLSEILDRAGMLAFLPL